MSEIPGFYFDPISRRYFRLLPDQHSNGPGLTARILNQRRNEAKRLNQLNCAQYAGKMQHQHQRQNSHQEIRKKKKSPPTFNIADVCFKQQLGAGLCGSFSKRSLTRHFTETRLKNAPIKPTFMSKVLDDYPSAALENCQFVDSCPEGKTILGCWSIQQPPWGSRIMCLDVKCEARSADDRHYGLKLAPTDNFICQLDKNVVDICQAKMDSSVTCILYITIPSTGGSRVFLQPLPELSNICDQEFLGSPIYNAHWSMSGVAWSCGWEPRNMRVSIGLERCGMIVDVVSETDFKLSSRNKNVLTQRFSKDGNLLYMGLRGAEIICCDLRRQYHHTIFSCPQMSTCWISVLSDNNYLLASNYYGEIKLWDLRQRLVVQEFKGLKNSHTKVPVILSPDESAAFAVGEDGTTNVWSVRNGESLCKIPAPYPVYDRDCIPKLCYNNNWGGLPGNSALVLCVKDELHFYELKL